VRKTIAQNYRINLIKTFNKEKESIMERMKDLSKFFNDLKQLAIDAFKNSYLCYEAHKLNIICVYLKLATIKNNKKISWKFI
jgi:hypothetical protein